MDSKVIVASVSGVEELNSYSFLFYCTAYLGKMRINLINSRDRFVSCSGSEFWRC